MSGWKDAIALPPAEGDQEPFDPARIHRQIRAPTSPGRIFPRARCAFDPDTRRYYYLALRERGLSSTAAFIALGRKIARLCFVLLRKEVDFEPNFRSGACMAT